VGETTHTVTVKNTGGSASTELPVVINNVPPSGLKYIGTELTVIAPSGEGKLSMILNTPVEFCPHFDSTDKNCARTFTVEPPLPPGLALGPQDGVIGGVVLDDNFYQKADQKHTISLTNSGGTTTTEVQLFFFDPKREFYEFIDENTDRYIKDLADIVAIESLTNEDDKDGCEKVKDVFKWLDAYTGNLEKLKSKEKDQQIEVKDLGNGVKGLHFHGMENSPTLGVYGHLDVDDPCESEFKLTEADGLLDGCGVLDSKGPLVAWLSTASAFCELGRDFPVGLKFVIDTNGRGTSGKALKSNAVEKWLKKADHICIAESNWLDQDTPCLTYGLRGTMHFTVTVTRGSKDLDSAYSGTMNQVMTDISAAMNALTLPDGHASYCFLESLVKGDDTNFDDITFDMEAYRNDIGIEGKLTENDKSDFLNAWWAHPSVSVHGVQMATPPAPAANVSAYKMPCEASFTFSVFTAHGMDNSEVVSLVETKINGIFENSTNQCSIKRDYKVQPFLADHANANYAAARDAVEQVHGKAPELVKSGDTLAAADALAKLTEKNVVIFPIGAPMKPNGSESIKKKSFSDGIKVYGRYICALCPRKPVAGQDHKKRAGAIFDEVDKDSDGELTADEFADWADENPEKAAVFFAFLDDAFWLQHGGNGDGKDAPLADKVDEFWKKVSKDFDANGDGKLNKGEFCVLYNRLTNPDSSLYSAAPAPVDEDEDSGNKAPIPAGFSGNKTNSSSDVKTKDKKVKKDKKWFNGK